MQFLLPTKSEEIAAVPAFSVIYSHSKWQGKKKVDSLSVQSLIIPKVNNHNLALARDTKDTQKGQKLFFFPKQLC